MSIICLIRSVSNSPVVLGPYFQVVLDVIQQAFPSATFNSALSKGGEDPKASKYTLYIQLNELVLPQERPYPQSNAVIPHGSCWPGRFPHDILNKNGDSRLLLAGSLLSSGYMAWMRRGDQQIPYKGSCVGLL